MPNHADLIHSQHPFLQYAGGLRETLSLLDLVAEVAQFSAEKWLTFWAKRPACQWRRRGDWISCMTIGVGEYKSRYMCGTAGRVRISYRRRPSSFTRDGIWLLNWMAATVWCAAIC